MGMGTKIKTKFEILAGMKHTTCIVKGKTYERWVADCGRRNGKRVRIARATKAECVRAVDELIDSVRKSGESILSLTQTQIADAILCYNALEAARKPSALFPIVKAYIESAVKETPQKPVCDAYDEYYSSFNVIQVVHRRNIQRRLGAFIETVRDKTVSDITANDVIAHLGTLKGMNGGECAPKTWNMAKNEIKSFFNWCAKKVRRYCDENPISDLDDRQVPSKIPEFATVDAVAALFHAAEEIEHQDKDAIIMRLALSYFAGMRTEEIQRLDITDIKLDEGSVFVRKPKGYQRGIPHRVVPLNETAISWLRTVDFKGMRTVPLQTFMRIYMDLQRKCKGFDYPKNSGRHSFITYNVATYSDITKTATIAGNSPQIIRSNYQGLATKAEGERYFAIRPTRSQRQPPCPQRVSSPSTCANDHS